jgi:hypothetical protein
MYRRALLALALTTLTSLAIAQDGRGGRFDDDLFSNLEGDCRSRAASAAKNLTTPPLQHGCCNISFCC